MVIDLEFRGEAVATVDGDLAGNREAPLMRIDRLYLDTSGTPVELAVSHFLPELYSYRISLRRSVT